MTKRITIELTEDQLRNVLNALYEWVESLESFDPGIGMEDTQKDLIAFNRRLIVKLKEDWEKTELVKL